MNAIIAVLTLLFIIYIPGRIFLSFIDNDHQLCKVVPLSLCLGFVFCLQVCLLLGFAKVNPPNVLISIYLLTLSIYLYCCFKVDCEKIKHEFRQRKKNSEELVFFLLFFAFLLLFEFKIYQIVKFNLFTPDQDGNLTSQITRDYLYQVLYAVVGCPESFFPTINARLPDSPQLLYHYLNSFIATMQCMIFKVDYAPTYGVAAPLTYGFIYSSIIYYFLRQLTQNRYVSFSALVLIQFLPINNWWFPTSIFEHNASEFILFFISVSFLKLYDDSRKSRYIYLAIPISILMFFVRARNFMSIFPPLYCSIIATLIFQKRFKELLFIHLALSLSFLEVGAYVSCFSSIKHNINFFTLNPLRQTSFSNFISPVQLFWFCVDVLLPLLILLKKFRSQGKFDSILIFVLFFHIVVRLQKIFISAVLFESENYVIFYRITLFSIILYSLFFRVFPANRISPPKVEKNSLRLALSNNKPLLFSMVFGIVIAFYNLSHLPANSDPDIYVTKEETAIFHYIKEKLKFKKNIVLFINVMEFYDEPAFISFLTARPLIVSSLSTLVAWNTDSYLRVRDIRKLFFEVDSLEEFLLNYRFLTHYIEYKPSFFKIWHGVAGTCKECDIRPEYLLSSRVGGDKYLKLLYENGTIRLFEVIPPKII
ncbi:MAG: hypothetical protein HZA01_04925 [Nitrospinae bacterium]|nr:hypothetical protein [Nitrospinota bacterium]